MGGWSTISTPQLGVAGFGWVWLFGRMFGRIWLGLAGLAIIPPKAGRGLSAAARCCNSTYRHRRQRPDLNQTTALTFEVSGKQLSGCCERRKACLTAGGLRVGMGGKELSTTETCHRTFPITFDGFHIFFEIFVPYTNSFARVLSRHLLILRARHS